MIRVRSNLQVNETRRHATPPCAVAETDGAAAISPGGPGFLATDGYARSLWTLEADALLRQMLAAGRTRAQCIPALSKLAGHPVTRNAVIGRANRLGIDGARRRGGGFSASKTHCPQGHPYEGDNLLIGPNGKRKCRICRTVIKQKSRLAKMRRANGEQPPEQRRASKPPAVALCEPPPALDAQGQRLTLLSLGKHQCHYIVNGEGIGAEFCGAPSPEGASWCAYHHRIVYQAGTAWTAKKAPVMREGMAA